MNTQDTPSSRCGTIADMDGMQIPIPRITEQGDKFLEYMDNGEIGINQAGQACFAAGLIKGGKAWLNFTLGPMDAQGEPIIYGWRPDDKEVGIEAIRGYVGQWPQHEADDLCSQVALIGKVPATSAEMKIAMDDADSAIESSGDQYAMAVYRSNVFALCMANRLDRLDYEVGPVRPSGEPLFSDYDPKDRIWGYASMAFKIAAYNMAGIYPDKAPEPSV